MTSALDVAAQTEGSQPVVLTDIGQPSGPHAAIGDYERLELIAQGGMGVVFKARQRSLSRTVALKLLQGGAYAAEDFRRRFRQEAETAASLQHPNVIKIYEVSEHQGQPFFSMEYVSGPNLAEKLGKKALPIKEAVCLVRTIAEAVAHAHERGVLHRDLKPSNILMGPDGRVIVTDFGLARQLGIRSDVTQAGQMLGTPPYSAPEQAQGLSQEITTAADVWSLGVIFYQMLTGRLPFQANSPFEIVQQSINTEPVSPRSLRQNVDHDLETICLKCLAKDPKRRYSDAKDLAEELDRWQKRQPILARPPSASERAVKWVQRRPAVAALTLALALGVTAFLVTVVLNHLRLKRERDIAAAALRVAQVRLAAALLHEGHALAAGARFAEAKDRLTESAAVSAAVKTSVLPAELSLADVNRFSPSPLLTLRGHGGKVLCLAVVPNEAALLSGGEDGSLRFWSFPMARQESLWSAHSGGVECLAVSSNGHYGVSGGADRAVSLWDLRKQALTRTITGHADAVVSVSFSSKDNIFASASRDRTIRLWDLASGRQLRIIQTGRDEVAAIDFSPDGRHLLSANKNGGLTLWDLAEGEAPARLDFEAGSLCAVYTPDGKQIFFGDSKGYLLDVYSEPFGGHEDRVPARVASSAVTALAWLPERGIPLVGTRGGAVIEWMTKSLPPGPLITFSGHQDAVSDIVLVAPGLAASASYDGTIQLWDSNPHPRRLCPPYSDSSHSHYVSRAVFSPNGRLIVSAGWDGQVKLWDTATGRWLADLGEHAGIVLDAAFSPDGSLAASCGIDGVVRLWPVTAPDDPKQLEAGVPIRCVTFSADGSLIIGGEGPSVRAGSVLTNAEEGPFSIRVWERKSGREMRRFVAHRGGVYTLARAKELVLSGGGDGKVKAWDSGTWSEVGSFEADPQRVNSIALEPGGTRFISAGASRTLKRWDLLTSEALFSVHNLRDEAVSLAVAPDAAFLMAGMRGGDLSFHDVSNGAELHDFHEAHGVAGFTLFGVDFSPDRPHGTRALSAGADGSIHVWDFSGAAAGAARETKARAARAALQRDPRNAKALSDLAEWFAYRNIPSWAAQLYARAGALGAETSPLALARAYWQGGQLPLALEHLQAAARQREAPDDYLRLCRKFLQRQIAAARTSSSEPIDPQGRCILQPEPHESKDIWTGSYYSNAPGANTPGGGLNDERLRVGGWDDSYHSLIQFSLDGCPGNAASAILFLFCFNLDGGGTPMFLDRIIQHWDWRTSGTGRDRDRLWWADRPPAERWQNDELPIPVQGRWYAIDITDLYNAWQSGTLPNYGLQLRPTPHLNQKFNEFYSADYLDNPALRPKLVIVEATRR